MSKTKPQAAAPSPPPQTQKRQPEKKIGPFNAGIGVCIWTNRIQTDQGERTVRSVTINPRRYFDRETNEWKDAPSFNPADLPALIFALQKAQEFVFEAPLPGAKHDGEGGNGSTPPPDEEIPF